MAPSDPGIHANIELTPLKAATRARPTLLQIKDGRNIPGSDGAMTRATLLDAIKDRIERDDIDGAKASLKLYKKTHPKLRIPDELKFLLK